jgi:hypothetical protein
MENWRKFISEVEDFPDITNDQSEIQKSLNYFYKEHAPSKGQDQKIGQEFGYDIIRFDIGGGELFYFLVDSEDVPKAYIALHPLEDGMQVGNVRKTKGAFRITELYKWLIKQHGILYSDTKQTSAGQKIWANLKNEKDIKIIQTSLPGRPLLATFEKQESSNQRGDVDFPADGLSPSKYDGDTHEGGIP